MKKIALLLFALSLSSHSYSTTFLVPDGTVRTTTLILPNFGDQGVVERFGIISVNGMVGILMNNSSQLALNKGAIFTLGANAFGILNNGGANNTIINNGLIATMDSNAIAIASNGSGNVRITNNGEILTNGFSAFGIVNFDINSIITNNGFITTNGAAAHGIVNSAANTTVINNGQIHATNVVGIGIFNNTLSVNSTIVNNGTIFSEQVQSIGISSAALSSVVINNGSISTLADTTPGILITAANNLVINTGFISALGGGTNAGIFILGNNSIIENSGTIVGENSAAIFGGVAVLNPTLILLRGSNIQGEVTFPSPINLMVERGLNLALTLTSSPGFNVLNIDAPFVVVGNTIGVIDPTGLGLQADIIADLSDTILDGIYRHRTAFACPCNTCGCEIWVAGIGSYRKRGYLTNMGTKNSQGGFIIGINRPSCYGNVGLFGALSFASAEVDQNTQKADIKHYIFGLSYERIFCDTFFGAALLMGFNEWSNERFVMHNLGEGGVEKAHSNPDGFFVSPEFSIAHSFSSLWLSPILSLTLRYAGCFFDSYLEEGSLTNLSIENREIDLLTTRFELSVPFTEKGCGCFSVEPYLGAFGRFQLSGEHVDGTLLQRPLSFKVGNRQNLAAFFLGCRGIHSFDRFNLFLNFEVSFDNAKSTRLLGEGGVGIHF